MTSLDIYLLGRLVVFGEFLDCIGFMGIIISITIGFIVFLNCDFSLEKVRELCEGIGGPKRLKWYIFLNICFIVMLVIGWTIPSRTNLYEMFVIPKIITSINVQHGESLSDLADALKQLSTAIKEQHF